MEIMMFLDSVDYEEFAISVGRLAELSFVYRILLDSDSALQRKTAKFYGMFFFLFRMIFVRYPIR